MVADRFTVSLTRYVVLSKETVIVSELGNVCNDAFPVFVSSLWL
jgi:hypothetical protein